MALSAEEISQLLHPVSSTDESKMSTSLLSSIDESQGAHSLLRQLSCLPCNICVKSKAAILILVWSVIIGAVYLGLLSGFHSFGICSSESRSTFSHAYMQSSVKFVVPVYTVLAAYAHLGIDSATVSHKWIYS